MTPGRYGEQYVHVLTFCAWVANLITVVISELCQINRNLGVMILGWTHHGQDGLYRRLLLWARSTADALQLQQKAPKHPSYRKFEASLLLEVIHNGDSTLPYQNKPLLQQALLVQFMLNTGLQLGECHKLSQQPRLHHEATGPGTGPHPALVYCHTIGQLTITAQVPLYFMEGYSITLKCWQPGTHTYIACFT